MVSHQQQLKYVIDLTIQFFKKQLKPWNVFKIIWSKNYESL